MDSVDGGCPPFIVPFRFVRVRWGFAKSFFLSSFNSFIYNTIESPPPLSQLLLSYPIYPYPTIPSFL